MQQQRSQQQRLQQQQQHLQQQHLQQQRLQQQRSQQQQRSHLSKHPQQHHSAQRLQVPEHDSENFGGIAGVSESMMSREPSPPVSPVHEELLRAMPGHRPSKLSTGPPASKRVPLHQARRIAKGNNHGARAVGATVAGKRRAVTETAAGDMFRQSMQRQASPRPQAQWATQHILMQKQAAYQAAHTGAALPDPDCPPLPSAPPPSDGGGAYQVAVA